MGQEVTTKDGRSWHFEPGAVFLDFVYTGDLGTGDPWWERLHTAADLDAWLAAHVSDRLDPASPAVLRDARILRLAMSRIVMALPRALPTAPEDWTQIAEAAARPDVPPTFPDGPARQLPAGRGIAFLARDAVVHLRDHSDALRVCAAPDCPLVFLDLSRGRSRQWCSMARCGNRAKVRSHSARHATKATPHD